MLTLSLDVLGNLEYFAWLTAPFQGQRAIICYFYLVQLHSGLVERHKCTADAVQRRDIVRRLSDVPDSTMSLHEQVL